MATSKASLLRSGHLQVVCISLVETRLSCMKIMQLVRVYSLNDHVDILVNLSNISFLRRDMQVMSMPHSSTQQNIMHQWNMTKRCSSRSLETEKLEVFNNVEQIFSYFDLNHIMQFISRCNDKKITKIKNTTKQYGQNPHPLRDISIAFYEAVPKAYSQITRIPMIWQFKSGNIYLQNVYTLLPEKPRPLRGHSKCWQCARWRGNIGHRGHWHRPA